MLDNVAEALATLDVPGAFAVRRTCSPSDLRIEVKGVGRIPLPVSATTAKKLCKVARKAPFGLRDKTLIDARIRDTWQIAKSRVKIDQRLWSKTLGPQLNAIQQALGLADEGTLSAELYKMLVYEPGQFFVPHQDSEKTDDMVGTLLVELPSAYTGGALLVEQRDQRKTFRRTARSGKLVTLVAFYADCQHEVKPIKSGYRIVLSFNLRFRNAGLSVRLPEKTIANLAQTVKSYFATPFPPDPYSKQEQKQEFPGRLIYLLDHEYTQKSLSWNRLKNGDRIRVGALVEVAKQLDYVLFLALADVREHWQCIEEDWGRRSESGRRWRGHDYDDYENDESPNTTELELIDLIENDIDLRHFIAVDGRVSSHIRALHVAPAELCFTIPSMDLDPLKAMHQGWMGNYGNTVERWYHRAALVMWPRANDFLVRAAMAPIWALDRLLVKLKHNEHDWVSAQVRAMLENWSHPGSRPSLFTKSLRLAIQLNDSELAAQWLRPFTVKPAWVKAAPLFVQLVEQYGLEWTKARFTAWGGHQHYANESFSPLLVGLCTAFGANPNTKMKELAKWLVNCEVGVVEREYRQWYTRTRSGHMNMSNHGVPFLLEQLSCLFKAAAVCSAASARDRLIATLLSPECTIPVQILGDLLHALRGTRQPETIRALGLSRLYVHLRGALQAISETTPRADDDWFIKAPSQCTCDDCKSLTSFLHDSSRVSFDWAMAQQRRQHIHHIVDGYRLPVSHKTLRKGSPHTLRLRKRPELFKQRAQLRAQQLTLLAWLEGQRDAFVGEP